MFLGAEEQPFNIHAFLAFSGRTLHPNQEDMCKKNLGDRKNA